MYDGKLPFIWKSQAFDVNPAEALVGPLDARYWSHVVKCRSCKGTLKAFGVLEIAMQAASIVILGAVAVVRQATLSPAHFWATAWVCTAVICYLASRWLSQFIYKNFYFHDYNLVLIK